MRAQPLALALHLEGAQVPWCPCRPLGQGALGKGRSVEKKAQTAAGGEDSDEAQGTLGANSQPLWVWAEVLAMFSALTAK